MIAQLKNLFSDIAYSIPGWHTKRRIVVIESDDWGAIRMPSRDTFKHLLDKGIRVDKCPFCSNDSLARAQDLERLFEVLLSVRDKNGAPCKITANSVVANPDFNKIKESDFQEYHYEAITETFRNAEGCERSFKIWKSGIESGIWTPQFHGREHLNVNRWMSYLQSKNRILQLAFDYKMFGLSTFLFDIPTKSFMAALDANNEKEQRNINQSMRDGLQLFHKLFGMQSHSFIAPNYTWSPELEPVLNDCGIKYLQGAKIQRLSEYDHGPLHKKILKHYTGQRNQIGMLFTIRNCNFEPTSTPNQDNVAHCLSQIRTAFRWHKPAIINSHRVNYIGTINPKNSERNLKLLHALLHSVIKEFPDIEFMDSNELGQLITHDTRN